MEPRRIRRIHSLGPSLRRQPILTTLLCPYTASEGYAPYAPSTCGLERLGTFRKRRACRHDVIDEKDRPAAHERWLTHNECSLHVFGSLFLCKRTLALGVACPCDSPSKEAPVQPLCERLGKKRTLVVATLDPVAERRRDGDNGVDCRDVEPRPRSGLDPVDKIVPEPNAVPELVAVDYLPRLALKPYRARSVVDFVHAVLGADEGYPVQTVSADIPPIAIDRTATYLAVPRPKKVEYSPPDSH